MRTALSSFLFSFHPFGRSPIGPIADLGFEGLETWFIESHLPWRESRAIATARREVHDAGLVIASVHLPVYRGAPGEGTRVNFSLLDPDAGARAAAFAEVEAALEAAAALGAETAVLHLGWPGDALHEENLSRALEAVAHFCARGDRLGVEVALENILSDVTAVEALVGHLDAVEAASGGVCVDLGHAHLEGGAAGRLAAAGDRLRSLHVHDNDGSGDQHAMPGAGSIEWSELDSALDAFEGWAALEVRDTSKGGIPPEALLEERAEGLRAFTDRYRTG